MLALTSDDIQNMHPHRARCDSRTRPVMSGGGASFNCRFFSTEISAIVLHGQRGADVAVGGAGGARQRVFAQPS
jgi:hypothetical protein